MSRMKKKLLAVLLLAVMALSVITGCTKKSSGANSLFGVTKEAMKVTKADYSTTVSIDTAGNSLDVSAKFFGTTDGNATSLSVEVKFGAMTYKLNDILVFTKDTLYFNVRNVIDQFSMYLNMMGIDEAALKELGLDSNWVKLEFESTFEKDTSLIEMLCDDLDTAYESLVTNENGVYTLSIDSKEEIENFTDLTRKLIEANSSKWAEAYAGYISKIDLNAMTDSITKDLLKALEEADIGLSAEDIEEKKNELNEHFNVDVDNITKEDIKEALDKMAENIVVDEDMDYDTTLVISGGYAEGSYTTTIITKEDDGSSYTVESKVSPNNKASVTVPDNAKSIKDILVPLLKYVNEKFEGGEDSIIENYPIFE